MKLTNDTGALTHVSPLGRLDTLNKPDEGSCTTYCRVTTCWHIVNELLVEQNLCRVKVRMQHDPPRITESMVYTDLICLVSRITIDERVSETPSEGEDCCFDGSNVF